MKLVADSGMWTTGPAVEAAPAVAVLEVSGAVLAWTVDDPSGVATTHVTFTDVTEAEWLWRVVGELGHVALLAAVDGREPGADQRVDIAGVELSAEAVAPLRRLALGHWLRRWWPASARDGIVTLDPAVLDVELALLTSSAQDYFHDEALDSEVADLLRAHRVALTRAATAGDPRVTELVTACSELADELGIAGMNVPVPLVETTDRRDDYALAAGSDAPRSLREPIASGVGSVDWVAVPPGMFDAADRTVDWTIELAESVAVASVRVATSAPPAGIEVRLDSGTVSGVGLLNANGHTRLSLLDAARQPVMENQAWKHDWTETTVAVGADVAASPEAAQTRQRLRQFARDRLARPGADAFLAEVLAAESDY